MTGVHSVSRSHETVKFLTYGHGKVNCRLPEFPVGKFSLSLSNNKKTETPRLNHTPSRRNAEISHDLLLPMQLLHADMYVARRCPINSRNGDRLCCSCSIDPSLPPGQRGRTTAGEIDLPTARHPRPTTQPVSPPLAG
jgi:hypothetical protein